MNQNATRQTIGQENAQRQINLMKDQELRDTYVYLTHLKQSTRSFHGLSLHDWRILVNREADRRGVK